MKILKSFARYAAGSLGAVLIGLISTPILTSLVPTVEMGKYSMFTTIGALASSVLYLGLDYAYVRYYNEENESVRPHLLNVCMRYSLLATILCSVVLLLFWPTVSRLVIGESSFYLAFLLALYVISLVIDRFWMLRIRMAQRAGAYSIINILRKLVYLAVSVVLAYTVCKDICWSLIIGIVASEAIVLLSARMVDRGDWYGRDCNLQVSVKQLFIYSFPFIFTTVIDMLLHSTDKLMLKMFSDYHEVGIYAGAQSIVNIISQLKLLFTTFWMPVAYEHFSKNPGDKEFFVRANKLVAYIMLTAMLALLCLKDAVVLFLGPAYRDAAYVFPCLAFMPVMYTVSETTVMGINFEKRTQYHVLVSVAASLANVIGNYFLVSLYGARGAAISTGLSYVVFFAMRTWLANRLYPIPFAMGKFVLSSAMVCILAVVACFKHVTFGFLLSAGVVFLIITLLYRDVIKQIIQIGKRYFVARKQ